MQRVGKRIKFFLKPSSSEEEDSRYGRLFLYSLVMFLAISIGYSSGEAFGQALRDSLHHQTDGLIQVDVG